MQTELGIQLEPALFIPARNQAHLSYMNRALEKLGPEVFRLLMQSRNIACQAQGSIAQEYIDKVDRILGLDPPGWV